MKTGKILISMSIYYFTSKQKRTTKYDVYEDTTIILFSSFLASYLVVWVGMNWLREERRGSVNINTSSASSCFFP